MASEYGNDGAYLPDLTGDLPVMWLMDQRGPDGDGYFLHDGTGEDKYEQPLPDNIIDALSICLDEAFGKILVEPDCTGPAHAIALLVRRNNLSRRTHLALLAAATDLWAERAVENAEEKGKDPWQ